MVSTGDIKFYFIFYNVRLSKKYSVSFTPADKFRKSLGSTWAARVAVP